MNHKLNTLDRHDTFHMSSPRRVFVEVVQGTAYVTREGDTRDYIVNAGEELCLDGRGLVVIEGFPNAAFQVCA